MSTYSANNRGLSMVITNALSLKLGLEESPHTSSRKKDQIKFRSWNANQFIIQFDSFETYLSLFYEISVFLLR